MYINKINHNVYIDKNDQYNKKGRMLALMSRERNRSAPCV